jgi:hypothetical protein
MFFIEYPSLAIVPAAIFAGLYVRSKRRLCVVLALIWIGYFLYESGMKYRLLCSGECNIRVDLLLIYPALALASIVGLVSGLRAKAAREP